MLIDIYSRGPEENKYSPDVIEVTDGLSQLILKIENTLFSNRGSVLGAFEFGCNLEELLFSLVLNESVIEQKIESQIASYCLNGPSEQNADYGINVKVQFFSTAERDGALVDIYVNEQRVIGALF